MSSLDSAAGYFYQYTYSQDNEELLQTCVTYLDKLIELWAISGFTLVCDSTHSGVYQMQSDVYIHQCTNLTPVVTYNPKLKAIINRGLYLNRSVEVIGVFTYLSPNDTHGYKYKPIVACFFLNGSDSKDFYTFQTAVAKRNTVDNRASVVRLLASLMHNSAYFVQLNSVHPIERFSLPEGVSRLANPHWLKLFQSVLNPTTKQEKELVLRFAELQPVFNNGMITHFLQRVVSQKNARPFLDYVLQHASYLSERYIISGRSRTSDSSKMLQLRIYKHLYGKLYGYDPKLQYILTMDQFQAYIDPQIRNAIEVQAENIQKSKELAKRCIHNSCDDSRKLVDQFADLSKTERATNYVTIPYKGKDQRIPFEMIPCAKCEQPFICGHKVIIRVRDAEQKNGDVVALLNNALEQFAVELTSRNRITVCGVCGEFLKILKEESGQQLFLSSEEVKELMYLKRYQKCHKVTMQAIHCLTTDSKFYFLNFVMDIFTNVYPRVKEMVLQFKPDHDYEKRKMHALITCVAAYFVNVQKSATGKTTLLFDLPRFYRYFAQNREITTSILDFQAQVDELLNKPFLASSVVLREPARELLFLRIAGKPFLDKLINSIGVQSIDALSKYMHKHSLAGKLGLKENTVNIDGLYSILIYDVLKEKNILPNNLGNAAAEQLRQFLYSKSVQELKDLGLLEFALYINSLEPVAVNSQFQRIYDSTSSSISYAKFRGCSMTDVNGDSQDFILRHDIPLTLRYTPSATLKMTEQLLTAEMKLFYQRYCHKTSPIVLHKYVDEVCQTCKLKLGEDPQQISVKQYADDLKTAMVMRAPQELKRPTVNRESRKHIADITARYNESTIQRVAHAMGLKHVQLSNLGGFDYMDYKEAITLPSVSPIKILDFVKQQQLSVYRRSSSVVIPITVSKDLDYIAGYQLDWGVFRNRFNRIQNHIRAFIFKCGQVAHPQLQRLSEVIPSMQNSHKNYYVHCQVLIFFFVSDLLEELKKTTNPQLITQFFAEMCQADAQISARLNRESKFSIHVQGDREMRVFNDDKVDEDAEVLADDEVSDVLP